MQERPGNTSNDVETRVDFGSPLPGETIVRSSNRIETREVRVDGSRPRVRFTVSLCRV